MQEKESQEFIANLTKIIKPHHNMTVVAKAEIQAQSQLVRKSLINGKAIITVK